MSILVSQVHMMAGQNKCKEKVPDVSDPNQNVERTCNSKLLSNLGDIHFHYWFVNFDCVHIKVTGRDAHVTRLLVTFGSKLLEM